MLSFVHKLHDGAFLSCHVIEDLCQQDGFCWQPVSRPGVILVPGGGYAYIAKSEEEPLELHFLTSGYSVFSLHYSVGDRSEYPTPVRQLYEAIRYVREHSEEWHLLDGGIVVAGFSAGGHLAALGAAKWQLPEFDDICNGEHELIRPSGAILGYPITDMRPLLASHHKPVSLWGKMLTTHIDETNVNAFVSGDMPPVFLWATRTDGIVPITQSLSLIEAMENAGVPYEAHVFFEGYHGLSTNDVLSNYRGARQGGHVPVNVASWLPLATQWLNALAEFD